MRLKLALVQVFRMTRMPLNNKTLKNEIETKTYRTSGQLAKRTLNNKTLKNEIETQRLTD